MINNALFVVVSKQQLMTHLLFALFQRHNIGRLSEK